MRLLPERNDDGGGRPSQGQAQPERRGDRRRHHQYLPVRDLPAHPRGHPRRRGWANRSAGASRSISASQNDLRRAGATARAMLIAAAAARWNVPDAECAAAQGVITHLPSGRNITFGRIAAAAADIAPPAQVALKEPKDWT